MKNRAEKYFLFLLLIVIFFGGCVATTVKQTTIREAIDVPTAIDAKPILFNKIVVKLRGGEKIGSAQIGLLYIPGAPLTWRGGRVTLSGDEFTEVFSEELEKANYPLVGNLDALFEDPGEWKAELLAAGLVKEMGANICYLMAGFRDYTTSKGETFIKAEWQIFSRLDRKVVYTTTTEGSSKLKQPSPTGSSDIFLDAFAIATQNLIADRGFHDLVVNADSQKSEPAGKVISITKSMPFQKEIVDNINAVCAGIVTVFAGNGHGSGFVIDNSDLTLTNAYVVRGAKFVIPIKDALDQSNIRLTDTTTNHIPYSVHRYDQNAISISKEDVDQEQQLVDEADRLKSFLFLYCHTYESKDIDKFATFFAHDALENNKPFHELLPKYRRNMEMIELLDYRIELGTYSLQANSGNIRLQGKFFIRYLLRGGTWKEKSGNISMELAKRGVSYLVKRLNYGD